MFPLKRKERYEGYIKERRRKIVFPLFPDDLTFKPEKVLYIKAFQQLPIHLVRHPHTKSQDRESCPALPKREAM